ncbi:MAG: hypothetical protein ACREXX_13980 [Gammaproteobacteria bacterium]
MPGHSRSWGYEVVEFAEDEKRPKCDGYPACERRARRHVMFVVADRVIAEKQLCAGHSPAQGRLYEGGAVA